jgi:AraC family transcriptional regulator
MTETMDLPASDMADVDWIDRTSLRILAASENLGWHGATVLLERQNAAPEYVPIPHVNFDQLSLLLAGSARIQTRHSSGAVADEYASAPQMSLFPKWTELAARWDAPWTFAVIQIHPQFLSEIAADFRGDPARIELHPVFNFFDHRLCAFASELANELQRANPLGTLYADSLVQSLVHHLLVHYSTSKSMHRWSIGSLSAAQMRLIDDYIHAHLDQKIGVADLARCLHISIPHFERMFRITMKRPPYKYVLEIRLQRAKNLLWDTRLSLIEIALQCGFSSQSHFTMHFRRFFGLTPARFAASFRISRKHDGIVTDTR